MPIWLRKFTFNQIKEHFEKEKEAHDNATNSGKNVAIGTDGLAKDRSVFDSVPQAQPKISKPGIKPTPSVKYK